jgi:hypothetical protein
MVEDPSASSSSFVVRTTTYLRYPQIKIEIEIPKDSSSKDLPILLELLSIGSHAAADSSC